MLGGFLCAAICAADFGGLSSRVCVNDAAGASFGSADWSGIWMRERTSRCEGNARCGECEDGLLCGCVLWLQWFGSDINITKSGSACSMQLQHCLSASFFCIDACQGFAGHVKV